MATLSIFTSACIDSVTNIQMVAKDCSYNHAMSYLSDTLGYEPVKCSVDYTPGITKGYTKAIMKKDDAVLVFYYDEDRGFLLFNKKEAAKLPKGYDLIDITDKGYILENKEEGQIKVYTYGVRSYDGIIGDTVNEEWFNYKTGLHQSWSSCGYHAGYYDPYKDESYARKIARQSIERR